MKPEAFVKYRQKTIKNTPFYSKALVDLEDRISVLKSSFEELAQLNVESEVVDILKEACLFHDMDIFTHDEKGKEFNERFKSAFDAINILKNIDTVYRCGDMCGGVSILPKGANEYLLSLEEHIKKQEIIFKDILHSCTKRLKPKGATRNSKRKYILPYQKKLDILLRSKGVKPKKFYEIIGDLFYGCGLEKVNPADEIKKHLPKASPKAWHDQ